MQVQGWNSIFQYGIIKERGAALFTDALRANLLESQGYKTQILEFIDMEHTPKNILIRAVKSTKIKKRNQDQVDTLLKELHTKQTLYELLHEKE